MLGQADLGWFDAFRWDANPIRSIRDREVASPLVTKVSGRERGEGRIETGTAPHVVPGKFAGHGYGSSGLALDFGDIADVRGLASGQRRSR